MNESCRTSYTGNIQMDSLEVKVNRSTFASKNRTVDCIGDQRVDVQLLDRNSSAPLQFEIENISYRYPLFRNVRNKFYLFFFFSISLSFSKFAWICPDVRRHLGLYKYNWVCSNKQNDIIYSVKTQPKF